MQQLNPDQLPIVDKSIFLGSFSEAVDEAKMYALYFWTKGQAFHCLCARADFSEGDDLAFDLTNKTRPMLATNGLKAFEYWANFGVAPTPNDRSNRFEMVLPPWHATSCASAEQAVLFAELYANNLHKLKDGYCDLNHLVDQCQTPQQGGMRFGDDFMVSVEAARVGSKVWREDKFTLAYNADQMCFLENEQAEFKQFHQHSPDRIGSDLTVFPGFAILSGQQNWMSEEGGSSEKKLLKALTRLATGEIRCEADEFIAASAQIQCQAIREKKPNGYVCAALIVAGDDGAAAKYMNWNKSGRNSDCGFSPSLSRMDSLEADAAKKSALRKQIKRSMSMGM